MTNDNDVKQQLAAIEHKRWSDWQKWVHKQLKSSPGGWFIDSATIARWQQQIHTPYFELSDAEKASDMEQVDRYWPIIQQLIVEARVDSLLDLEQWIKLHDLDTQTILEGIEHMCISNMQYPDQMRLQHIKRIKELQQQLKEEQ